MADNTSQIAGLFMTPELYQQQQDQQALAQAAQLAQLDPMARANTLLGFGGYKAAGGIGQALGAQDPMLQLLSARKAVLQNVNPNDPRSLMAAAAQLQGTDPQGAMQLAQQARAAQEQMAKISSEGLLGKLAVAGKYTPESMLKFQQSGNVADLEALDLSSKPPADWLAAAKELGLPAAKTFNDYTPSQVGAVNQLLQNRSIESSRAKATIVNTDLAGVLREVSAKEDARGKQEAWAKAGDAYKLQKGMVTKLDAVEAALPKTFTGSFADTALGFGKTMSALGLPVDETKLSNTEYMNNVSSQVVQTIARNFPGSLAVKELEELKRSKFNSQQQMQTIMRVLKDLKKEMGASVKTYEQMAKMPQAQRYDTDFNSLYGKNLDMATLEDKVKSGTATREEALKLKQLRSE